MIAEGGAAACPIKNFSENRQLPCYRPPAERLRRQAAATLVMVAPPQSFLPKPSSTQPNKVYTETGGSPP
jgi:hypothetical protein